MLFEHIAANRRLTWMLVFLFVLLVSGLAYLFAAAYDLGPWLAVGAFALSALSAWSTWMGGDHLVLAMSGARLADRNQHRVLFDAAEGLSIAAMLPVPRLYVIEDTAPNAFATGRDPAHASVAVTTGLLAKLKRDQLHGVIGHELAHIGNYDTRLMVLISILVGTVALMSDWMLRWGRRSWREGRKSGGGIVAVLALVAALLAPLAALLMQLAISRRREFLADACSAQLTRNPEALAEALERLDADTDPLEAANKATAPLYIVNPLKEHGGALNSLFSTHPPISERARRLREM